MLKTGKSPEKCRRNFRNPEKYISPIENVDICFKIQRNGYILNSYKNIFWWYGPEKNMKVLKKSWIFILKLC